jgi:palmitoyl-protein thioesterase
MSKKKAEGLKYVMPLWVLCVCRQDTENGFFMAVNKQVQKACMLIRADPKLAGGYNAIGFSQGSQFLYVDPPIHPL